MPDLSGITETERVLAPGSPAHPQREIWRLLKGHDQALRVERETAAKEAASARQRQIAIAADVAAAQHELTTFVRLNGAAMEEAGLSSAAGMLASIEHKFARALQKNGCEVIDPVGEPYDVAMSAWVDVHLIVPVEGVERPTVRVVHRAGVRLDEEVVRRPLVELAVPPPEPTPPPLAETDPTEKDPTAAGTAARGDIIDDAPRMDDDERIGP